MQPVQRRAASRLSLPVPVNMRDRRPRLVAPVGKEGRRTIRTRRPQGDRQDLPENLPETLTHDVDPATIAKESRAAATVVSISSSLCADERKSASNCDGAK